MRDSLDHVRLRGRAAAELEHHARFGRLLHRAEALRLVHHEVDLRRLDAAHLADRALELSLEGAAVVDALREVRHAPRRLVEQLEAGPALAGHPATGEGDARLGDVRSGDEDVGAAALELVEDAGLVELVRHLSDALQRNAAEGGDPLGLARPA